MELNGGSAVEAGRQFIVAGVVVVVEIDFDDGSPIMVLGEMVVGPEHV
jgi:hypothetical protein